VFIPMMSAGLLRQACPASAPLGGGRRDPEAPRRTGKAFRSDQMAWSLRCLAFGSRPRRRRLVGDSSRCRCPWCAPAGRRPPVHQLQVSRADSHWSLHWLHQVTWANVVAGGRRWSCMSDGRRPGDGLARPNWVRPYALDIGECRRAVIPLRRVWEMLSTSTLLLRKQVVEVLRPLLPRK
jgi:hypothetical protein